mmetsp:Transcript_105027/g.208801  ORF Transcript_105027/g.208801 Transcript_105027/m.208801 type:complete len:655 (-) Transcript_105027:143-2107(-)
MWAPYADSTLAAHCAGSVHSRLSRLVVVQAAERACATRALQSNERVFESTGRSTFVHRGRLLCGACLGLSLVLRAAFRHHRPLTRAVGLSPASQRPGLLFNRASLRLRGAIVASLTLVLWTFSQTPVWASALPAPSLPTATMSTSLSARLASYQSMFGSLAVDSALGASAFFVFAACAGTETAITTLWPWKVRELAQRETKDADEQGTKRIGMWSRLREDINRFIQTILIGSTISSVLSTVFVTHICGQLFGARGLAIATLSVTVGQLVLCEILPKSLAVSNAYAFARLTLPFFNSLSWFVYPVCRNLSMSLAWLLRCCGISIDASKTAYVSEQELDLMLKDALRAGVLETEEGKMISRVRNLDTSRASDIMIPLVDMVCINAEQPISVLQNVLSSTQYSRLPVYQDRFDNIVGIVSIKALLRKVRSLETLEWETVKILDILDEAHFVPETMTVLNLLQFLKERSIAVCVDEYGGTAGLVTLEDALEEIVGEIYDPDVEPTNPRHMNSGDEIVELQEGRFSMKASTSIDDVNWAFRFELPEGNYNSIGGFMADVSDRIPSEGDAVMVRTAEMVVQFIAAEVDLRKVVRVEANREWVRSGSEDGRANEGSDISKEDGYNDDGDLARVVEVKVLALCDEASSQTSETTEDPQKEED